MSSPFAHTTRALRADAAGQRTTLLLAALGALCLLAWAGWFLGSEVAVRAVSPTARLEAAQEVRAVQAVRGGPVAEVHLQVGAAVSAGDLLLRLDTRELKIQAREARAREQALGDRVAALQAEARAATEALAAAEQQRSASVAEAQASLSAAEATARFARAEARRTDQVYAKGHVSESEAERTRAEAELQQARAAALSRAVGETDWQGRSALADRRAELEALRARLAQAEAERAAAQARCAGLDLAIEDSELRAPVDGVLGDVAVLHPGAVLAAGEQVAAVVPDSAVAVVAEFAPAQAVGRIRAGQAARVRLDGFPSSQYGALPARVAHVASEARNGHVRVELELLEAPGFPVPVDHGLPGSVEVELEQASPAALALRAAGRLATAAGR